MPQADLFIQSMVLLEKDFAGGKAWLEGRKGEERAWFTSELDYR